MNAYGAGFDAGVDLGDDRALSEFDRHRPRRSCRPRRSRYPRRSHRPRRRSLLRPRRRLQLRLLL